MTETASASETTSIFGMKLTRAFVGEIQIFWSVIFFGISFCIQRQGMINGIKPITFNGCRYVVSTFILYMAGPYLRTVMHSDIRGEKEAASERTMSEEEQRASDEARRNDLVLWGGVVGLANAVGSILQQIGMVTVSASKTGFITGMYSIFIPIFEFFIPGLGAQLTWKAWAAAMLSLGGMFLLSGCAETDVCIGGAIKQGEIIVFISMFCWVASIMANDLGAKEVDAISLTHVQLAICLVISVIVAVFVETDQWTYPFTDIRRNWLVIISLGFTEAAGFTLRALGQMYSHPTKAGILLSLVSVPSGVLAYFFLGEQLTYIELVGCLLMIIAAFMSTAGGGGNHSSSCNNNSNGSYSGINGRGGKERRVDTDSAGTTVDSIGAGSGLEMGGAQGMLNENTSLLAKDYRRAFAYHQT